MPRRKKFDVEEDRKRTELISKLHGPSAAIAAPPPVNSKAPTVAQPPEPPRVRHGPQTPHKSLYGVAHLRDVMNIKGPDLERLCEDAALEIERLRAEQKKEWWR